ATATSKFMRSQRRRNLRPAAVELGRLLEGVADPHDAGLVERLAGYLKSERQAVLKTDRHRQRRTAGQIVRPGIGSPLERRVGRNLVDQRCRPGRVRRNYGVNAR